MAMTLETMFAFLLGEGEIDGCSFGDGHPNYPGKFWWRAHLRSAMENHLSAQAKVRVTVEDIDTAEAAYDAVIDKTFASDCGYGQPWADRDGICAALDSFAARLSQGAQCDECAKFAGHLKEGQAPFERYMQERKDCGGCIELLRQERLKSERAAVPDGMVLVTQEDGNNYCRILTLLGMEEEGDAVEAIEKLLAAPQPPEGARVVDGRDTEIARLNAIINTPQADDFLRAVSTEAEHQRQRWGNAHDAGKAPADWFWLVGYLGGKALHAHTAGNVEKAEHHVITTAAACANWHRAMFGKTNMRPGIDGEAALAAPTLANEERMP